MVNAMRTWEGILRPASKYAALACALVCSSPVFAEEFDCVIEPHMVVDLSSRVDGIVESMEVERGELIDKDQVLVRLESGVEQAAVEEARVRAEATAELVASQTSVEFAHRRNERIKELHRSQHVSTDQLDEIETEYELSRLQLERAQENRRIAQLELRQAEEVLNRHTLRSPIRGIVVQHYLAPGEAVEEQPIMRLAQIDPLRVEVIVPVARFGRIKVGQKAVMRPEPPMEGEFPAVVTIVDGVADAASGTFRVRLGLPNEDYGLPSGLRCRVKFLPYEEPEPVETFAETEPGEPEPLSAGAAVDETDSSSEKPDEVDSEDVATVAAPEAPAEDQADNAQAMGVVEPATERTVLTEREAPAPNIVADALNTVSPDPANAQPTAEAQLIQTGETLNEPQRCQTIGPLKNRSDAAEVVALLDGQATKLGVREESRKHINSFLLLVPDQGSPEATRAYADRLTAAGWTDFQIFYRGPHDGRISLGLFRNKRYADEQVSRLTQLGFEAVLTPQAQGPRFWLDVIVAPEANRLDVAAINRTLGNANVRASVCDAVVVREQLGGPDLADASLRR